MKNSRLRHTVVAATALTAGLLMTACQGDSDSASSGKDTAAVGKAANARNAKGVNGTFKDGKVTFLAPGTYTVSVPDKGDQQFRITDDTEIWGYGDICGSTDTDEGGEGGIECHENELVEAAKKGFTAEVVIKNGIATKITDDH